MATTLAKYQKYAAYKESQSDWMGEIPAQWSLSRLKYIFSIKKRIAGNLGHEVLSITQKGIKVKDTESGDGQLSMDYSKYQLVHIGDFAMNHMDLLTGYVDISKYHGVTSPDYRVFAIEDSEKFYSRYYLYLLQMGYKQQLFFHLGQGSSHLGRWRLPTEAFNEVIYPVPSIQEQTQIANFLDHETAKIDSLIEKQQKLIELLQEKRQAVISHAVTKGLNLDVTMKDSGVEWLGEVPEYWEITKVKYVAGLTPKKSELLSSDNRLCTFVPMEKLKLGNIVKDEEKPISEVIAGYTYFKDGDLLLAKVTPCFENKNMCIANGLKNGVGFGSSEIYVLRVNVKVNTQFLFYRLQEEQFMELGSGAMTGAGGLKRVPSEFLNNFEFLLPPLEEQFTIVEYLNEYLLKNESLMGKAYSAIQLMQERRTALISAAVTGKIDVRNWQAPDKAVTARTI